MPELHDLLERRASGYEPAHDLFERVVDRRERRDRNRRIRAGAVGVAIALVVGWWGIHAITSSAPKPANPQPPGIFSGVGGWITYGDKNGIWAVDPARPGDPNDQIQLSSDRGTPFAWSSDGSTLLVERDGPDGTSTSLDLLNADGTWTRLAHGGAYTGGSFSPDGTEVIYGDWSRNDAIYSVDVAGGRPRLVKEAPYVYGAAFSPDGSQVAYFAGHGDWGNRLHVMNADGSDVHALTGPDYGHVGAPAWSPDGSRLAFSTQGGGLWIVGVDGSGLTELIPTGDHPAWSPDGSRISYQQTFPDPGTLEIVTLDGADIRDIEKFGYAESGPWNPIAP